MRKSLAFVLGVALGSLACFSQAGAQGGPVESLRGDVKLDHLSALPAPKEVPPSREAMPRAYLQQPPLIPHSIDGYTIDRKTNVCLTCHSWANYKATGATKLSPSHFVDRDGNQLADMSPRRYFCTQCHVPQVDAPPLVENTFKPVKAMGGQ